jgi:diguanylate cyclase (GGDEF)-like protein/PAS domain S-box-containing protein
MTYDLPVERILHPGLLSCPPETPLHDAARLMSASRCSSILVMDGDRLLGIWTERDALAIDFSLPDALAMPISRVMSSPVKTLPGRTSVGEAALRFKLDSVRHYVVVDDAGQHLGIVTQSDVVQNQGVEYFVQLRDVNSVLREPPIWVSGSLPLGEAAGKMREVRRDALVVSGPDGELGILTERDIIHFISHEHLSGAIWDMASKPLLCVPGDSSLYHARTLFSENHVRHLGVTGPAGELTGLITYGDILASIEHDYVQELQKALREREQQLSISNHHLKLAQKVFDTTAEGILVTDDRNRIESVNPAFTRITGYEAAEVLGAKPSILKSGQHDPHFYREMWAALELSGAWQGEIWNRRKNGEVFPEWLSISTVRDPEGRITNYVAIFTDITARKEAEDRVRHLAYHDALTGLPNRSLFLEHLDHALHHAHRQGSRVALMFLDLDRFKLINDTLGHAMGDKLLVETARRLSGCVREGDTVSRLGGDEFTVILEDLRSATDAAAIARKIIDTLSQPMVLDGHELFSTPSIGISLYPNDSTQAETLLKQADAAMYRAKERGRHNYQFYTPDMNARAFERLALENKLRRALEREELVLHYQPRVDILSRKVTGMEALVRWNHPDFGLIPPADFIPIAEESGLIVPIGEWVLHTACAQNKRWQEQGFPKLCMAVNISARQFKHAKLVESVRRALDETGLDPACLELEITESIAMEHADESVKKLRELKTMGVRLSMDDFGTGHSSLSYLKQFPIDSLKIDKSFIQDTSQGSKDAAIAVAISAMAEQLHLKVITEGVETQEQLSFLVGNQSGEVQGFYFSHPLPAEEFASLLQSGKIFDQD